ncbi:MAG: sulfite exporter TauE/SafE family protein [Actinomycetota bacterium]|nr:sulfite exporter TauE/SafE family protein [Acidimicrobiia bacterium]MDQ3294001.1 sulfite exporter TauE/SafE family protein [Actinomycetota bacterium]
MSLVELLLGTLVMTVGATLQASVGFGSNLVAAPLLLLIDDGYVPAPVVIASLVLNLLVARREGRASVHPGVNVAISGQVLGIVAAGAVLVAVPERGLSLLFGALVLVAVILSSAGWYLSPTRRTLAGAGVAAGFMGTVSGIGGPPMALVYQRVGAATLRATLARFFLAGGVVSIPTLLLAGEIGRHELGLTASLLPGTVVGYFVGGRLSSRLDGASIRPIVLGLSAVSAIAVLARELV